MDVAVFTSGRFRAQLRLGHNEHLRAQGKLNNIWHEPQVFPHLTRIYNERREKGLVVIGISVTDDPGLQGFVDQQGDKMGYTVAIDQAGSAGQLMKRAKIQGIPHAFIVGRDGKIAYRCVALPTHTVCLWCATLPWNLSLGDHLTHPAQVSSAGTYGLLSQGFIGVTLAMLVCVSCFFWPVLVPRSVSRDAHHVILEMRFESPAKYEKRAPTWWPLIRALLFQVLQKAIDCALIAVATQLSQALSMRSTKRCHVDERKFGRLCHKW